MLTNEQIRKLKEGDKLFAEVSFISVDKDNDLECVVLFTDIEGDVIERVDFFNPACLSLPPEKPKYDPCRRLRKGDKVRVVERNGRIPLYLKPYINTVHTVSVDEDINGYIRIEGDIEMANVAYIELVTPVEELDLYFVLDSPATYNVCKRGEPGFAATFFKKYPLARKKADEYCEALNEEIRKEQTNG